MAFRNENITGSERDALNFPASVCPSGPIRTGGPGRGVGRSAICGYISWFAAGLHDRKSTVHPHMLLPAPGKDIVSGFPHVDAGRAAGVGQASCPGGGMADTRDLKSLVR